MGDLYRRVVLKPLGLTGSQSAALAEHLAVAVHLQNELASGSPHVLRLLGDVQEFETGYYVDHEPAAPLAESLFDRDSVFAEDDDPDKFTRFVEGLLDWAAALLDALRAAHSRQGAQPAVHGGLCGGTLLVTTDHCRKISDFGFAPAICAALGRESYVNLAVGPHPTAPDHQRGTAIWEVLSPDKQRSDRLCGFIDPVKYANDNLDTFEPGSDIIAAGFLLHLLDLHRHPYLPDPRDHLLVGTADTMAFQLYDGARRKRLRDSNDPRVKLWCKLVERMLDIAPAGRPSATEAIGEFAKVGVAPWNRETGQIKHLGEIQLLLQKGEWTKALSESQSLATDPAGDAVAAHANAYADLARVTIAVEKVRSLVAADDVAAAREAVAGLPEIPTFENLPELPGLSIPSGFSDIPRQAGKKIAQIQGEMQAVFEASEKLDSIEADVRAAVDRSSKLSDGAAGNVEQLVRSLRDSAKDLAARLKGLPPDEALSATMRQRRTALAEDLEGLSANLKKSVAAVEGDKKQATDWLGQLQQARDQGDPDRIGAVLKQRPVIRFWPPDVLAEAKVIEAQTEELKSAIEWLGAFRRAVEALETDHGNLQAAQKLFGKKPAVSYWPDHLRRVADELSERLTRVEREVALRAQAQQWIDAAAKLVADQKWGEALDLLEGKKPPLASLPPEYAEPILRREKELSEVVYDRIGKLKRIQQWFKQAQEAAAAADYAKALGILGDAPVAKEELDKEARQSVASLEQECRDGINKQRHAAVQKSAVALLNELFAKGLRQFLRPDSVDAAVEAVELGPVDDAGGGTARLKVRLREIEGVTGTLETAAPFQFEFVSGTPKLVNEPSVREQVESGLKGLVQKLQQHQAAALSTPLRDGLFPKGKVEVALSDLTTRAPTTVCFLGPKAGNGKFETEIVWEPSALTWRYADPAALLRQAVSLTTKDLRNFTKARLLEESDLLREFNSMIHVDVDEPDLTDQSVIPPTLAVMGRLVLKAGPQGERRLLDGISITVEQIGRIAIQDKSHRAAEAAGALQQILKGEQDRSRTAIENQLRQPLRERKIKASLTASTKTAASGRVEAVEFALRPKGGERIALRADWNLDAFEFVLTNDAAKALENLLANPPEVKPVPRVVWFAGVPSAVLVVGIAVALATGMFQKGPAPEPPPESNTNINGSLPLVTPEPPEDEPTVPDEPIESVKPIPVQITRHPAPTRVCAGGIATFSVAADGEIDGYQWFQDGEPIAGETDPRLEVREVTRDRAGQYLVEVLGPAGNVRSEPATLSVDPATRITAQPAPATADEIKGSNVTFSVSAEGSNVSYAWYKEGEETPVGSGASLTLANVTEQNGGTYYVVVKGDCGEVTSGSAFLMVGERVRSYQPVVADIRGYIERDELLANFQERLAPEKNTGASASLSYRVPGLNNPERSAALTAPADNENNWQLAAGEAAKIETAYADLATLLAEPPPAEELVQRVRSIAATSIGPFVQPGSFTAAMHQPRWELNEDGSSWIGSGSATVGLPGRANAFDLNDIGITLRDGVVSVNLGENIDVRLEREIVSTLRDVQSEALGTWLAGLEVAQRTAPAGASVNSPPLESADLRRNVEVVVGGTSGDLVERVYSADWNPEQFRFEPAVDWSAAVAAVAQAAEILEALNDRAAAVEPITRIFPADWRFQEVGSPTASNTMIAVALPWSEAREGQNPRELAPERRVELLVPIAPVESTVADFLQSPPSYWPLLGFRAEAIDHPYVTEAPNDPGADTPNPWSRVTLPERLENLKTVTLQYIALKLTPFEVTDWQPGADPPLMELSLRSEWSVRGAPVGLAVDDVAGGVAELTSGNTGTYTLRATAPGGRLQTVWNAVDGTATESDTNVDALAGFDRLLREYPVRREVENALATASMGEVTKLSEADAYTLLQEIWRAKGTAAVRGSPARFAEFSTGLTQLKNFSDKSGRIVPTVFIEYFSGPTDTYAVIWSAHEDRGVYEGPNLVHVCTNDKIEPGAPAGDWGQTLFGPVLQSVDSSVKAEVVSPFESGYVGLLIAPDARISLSGTPLADLTFQPRTTYLEEYDTIRGMSADNLNWDSLASLRNLDKKRADFRLVKTLSQPSVDWFDVPDPATLIQATQVFEKIVKGAAPQP